MNLSVSFKNIWLFYTVSMCVFIKRIYTTGFALNLKHNLVLQTVSHVLLQNSVYEGLFVIYINTSLIFIIVYDWICFPWIDVQQTNILENKKMINMSFLTLVHYKPLLLCNIKGQKHIVTRILINSPTMPIFNTDCFLVMQLSCYINLTLHCTSLHSSGSPFRYWWSVSICEDYSSK